LIEVVSSKLFRSNTDSTTFTSRGVNDGSAILILGPTAFGSVPGIFLSRYHLTRWIGIPAMKIPPTAIELTKFGQGNRFWMDSHLSRGLRPAKEFSRAASLIGSVIPWSSLLCCAITSQIYSTFVKFLWSGGHQALAAHRWVNPRCRPDFSQYFL
jgi:hypothetical protein